MAKAQTKLNNRAVRGSIRRLVRHLGHALNLAAIAQRNEPEWAAGYIADTLHDLRGDVSRVIAAARTR